MDGAEATSMLVTLGFQALDSFISLAILRKVELKLIVLILKTMTLAKGLRKITP